MSGHSEFTDGDTFISHNTQDLNNYQHLQPPKINLDEISYGVDPKSSSFNPRVRDSELVNQMIGGKNNSSIQRG